MISLTTIADVAETVRRQLVLLSEWPETVRWVVFAAAVAILAMTVWNVRKARPLWHRILLVTLRLLILLLLFFLFMEPSIQEERVARHRSEVLVLVDDSRSMALADGDLRRTDLAQKMLADEAFWSALAERSELVFYRFSEHLEPFDRASAQDALQTHGDRTDLVGALTDLRQRYRDRDLGAVLVLSDGIDNATLSARQGNTEGLDEETLRLVRSFGVPIDTYGVSGAGDLRDVAVEALRVGDFAFLKNRTSLDVVLRVVGVASGELQVSLREDGELLARETRPAPTDSDRVEIPFTFVPKTLGEHVYTVVVAPLKGEVSDRNNARSAVVRVLRDRIRVLQIAGHPSWDVRFLRNLLKRNPNVDLISFFILVNTSNVLPVRSDETSLIPFPAQELFVDELGSFDLIVLQDFNYGPFSTREHLHRIRDFVRHGGALLMVGGRLAFSAGGYAGTDITTILPVHLPLSMVPDRSLSTAPFRPRVTDAGRRHPVMQLGADEEETAEIFANLPPLEGANLFDGLTDGGLALAVHPDLTWRGKPRPVIAVGEAGEGRVMVFGSDASWFWSIINAGTGGDPHVYDRFWSNAVRWLIRDPALDLVQVRCGAERLSLGDELTCVVELRRPDYQPAAGVSVDVKLWRRASGRAGDMERLVDERSTQKTDADGRITVTWKPEETGIYEVLAGATLAGLRREGRDLLSVDRRDPEMDQLVPTRPSLEAIAAATEGRFATLDRPGPPPPVAPPKALEVIERRFDDLWTSPWLLVMAILLFGGEWWLRRRWGYL